jgi:hypothetical protein
MAGDLGTVMRVLQFLNGNGLGDCGTFACRSAATSSPRPSPAAPAAGLLPALPIRARRWLPRPAVARSISNLDRQAQALAAVAEGLAARGDTRQARHAASAACTVGRWTTVLGLVLSLEPSALRVLTDL